MWLADPEMKLDVGAFAKGYAVEMVAQYLESIGKTGYVVNVGGNIRTAGAKPSGDKWLTGIENPTGEAGYLEYVELEREAIPLSRSVCRIVGAELSEEIGDFAALAVAETKGGQQNG